MNATFSIENKKILTEIIQDIKTTFNGAVMVPPEDTLHITLMDWISPLVDYGGRDKGRLFAEIQPDYDKVLSEITSSMEPITVQFKKLAVSPSTIIIVGTDNGAFQEIRERFLREIKLLPGTRMPPDIIHSSISRFTKVIGLDSVKAFVAGKNIDITQQVTAFELVNSLREPMLEFELFKKYPLQSEINHSSSRIP